MLTGTVTFYNNTALNSIIALNGNSELAVDGKLQFIKNTISFIIDFHHNSNEYIMINETSVVEISLNYLCALFIITSSLSNDPYPYCFFQYFNTDNLDNNYKQGNFLIEFYYNNYNTNTCMVIDKIVQTIPTTNCQWLPRSSFNASLPLDVNKEYIQYTDSTGTYNRLPHVNEPNTLCVCTNISHYDCSITI